MKFVRTTMQIVTWAMLAAAGFAAPVTAQTPPHAPAGQAEAAAARGLAMAKQKQWALAIRYFRQAHELNPTHPAILLNLALANDRAGGRELIAEAWYRAYLASVTDAPNAQQVKQRAGEIDIGAETQIQQLITTALRIAGETQTTAERARVYGAVMRAQAAAGDVAGMRRTQSLGPDKDDAEWALAMAAAFRAWSDNPALAKSEIATIALSQQQSWALAELAVASAERGNQGDAIAIAKEVKNKTEAAFALSRIAALRARVNDLAGARATIELIDAKRYPIEHAVAQGTLATALARSNDSAAVTELATAESDLGNATDLKARSAAETQIAVARILMNGGSGAESELKRLGDTASRYRALKALASAHDDAQAAEIFRWTALAFEMDELPSLADLNATVDAAKGRSPVESGVAVARAAEDEARYLMRFRYGD